jgi:hypothetical protein
MVPGVWSGGDEDSQARKDSKDYVKARRIWRWVWVSLGCGPQNVVEPEERRVEGESRDEGFVVVRISACGSHMNLRSRLSRSQGLGCGGEHRRSVYVYRIC